MAYKNEQKVNSTQRRGRGASSNVTNRFDPYVRENVHDGWDIPEDLPQIRTHVTEDTPNRIITKNTSPDIPFDRSINPYRGCEHGCIYCFARPTHAYLGHSAGLDFETKLIARPSAPDLLRTSLSYKWYSAKSIALGTNTDPYQPIEKTYQIMRGILQVMLDFKHPVTIVTKGSLIERDIDLLADLNALNLVHVAISITTLDAELSRKMEPRVPAPKRRLLTVQRLAEAGLKPMVMMAPIVPGLTDHEIEPLLSACKDAGAHRAAWVMLRLPREVAPLFKTWADEHYPDRAKRILARIRETHGGVDYKSDWGKRMRGEGTYADLIAQRFRKAAKRLGLNEKSTPLRTDLFKKPTAVGENYELF